MRSALCVLSACFSWIQKGETGEKVAEKRQERKQERRQQRKQEQKQPLPLLAGLEALLAQLGLCIWDWLIEA